MAEMTRGYIRTTDEKGSINISQSVVATIAAAAAVDVDGVYGLCQSPGKELTDVSGKKGISRGAKVIIEEDKITADLFVQCKSGYSVGEIGAAVQKAVMTAVEQATSVKVDTVNVHVCGVSEK